MTQEEKNLLIKDLCVRLSYGVIIKTILDNGKLIGFDIEREELHLRQLNNKEYRYYTVLNDDPKPYLRPMSSMTEEEEEEWWKFKEEKTIVGEQTKSLDWLNTHHFDYRGLIEKGLALEAPEGMYNFKTTCNNCEDKNYCSQSEYVKNNCYKLK